MPASARYQELVRLPTARLEELMKSSKAPALDSIHGWEWRGYNTPWFCSLVGIRKFIKGFFKTKSGIVEGYNIPPRQNALTEEWIHKPSPEAPKRFGFYLVGPCTPADNIYPDSLLLDYGASPRNFAATPERLLRDYLVQPDAGNPDILLGKAYLALGPRVPVSYFVIERLRRSDFQP